METAKCYAADAIESSTIGFRSSQREEAQTRIQDRRYEPRNGAVRLEEILNLSLNSE